MHTSMIGMAVTVLLAVLISSSECRVVGRSTYATGLLTNPPRSFNNRRTTPMTPTDSEEVRGSREEEGEEVRSRAFGDDLESFTDKMHTKGSGSKWVTRGMHSGEDVETSTIQGFRPRGMEMHSGSDEYESSTSRHFIPRGMHSGEELESSTPIFRPRGMGHFGGNVESVTPMDTFYTRSLDMDDTESSTHGWNHHQNVNSAYPMHQSRGVNQPRPIDWEQKSTPSNIPQGGHSTPRGSM